MAGNKKLKDASESFRKRMPIQYKTDEEAESEAADQKAQEDADQEAAMPSEPIKKDMLKKLAPDMGEAKSMDYEEPKANPTPEASPEPIPAHRRRMVIVPKQAKKPVKSPDELW